MRILLTADPELPVPPKLYGGIERIIDVLLRGLQSLGHEVALVANKDSEVPAEMFAWKGSYSQRSWDTLINSATLFKAVNAFKPDLLHSFSRLLYMLPLMRQKLPKIMSYQRYPGAGQINWGVRLAQGTLHFTGCSKYICQVGIHGGGNWQAIHNCVELEKYTFQPIVASNAPLVFLSRVEKIKGAHTAIAAARKSGRRLLIAGNYATKGPEAEYWQQQIVPHLGKEGIEYVGTVNDQQKNQLLGQAAALLVPIEWEEPFGIVFAEALACGTPVISTPRGALPEIIRTGTEGYLNFGIDGLCDAISRIADINRYACRQRVEERFSASVIVEEYERLYKKLLHQ